ncbi:MAG: hypothetical protein BroJett018_25050 [Chloroflexota bacterium]|nr:MAG: hypothetical protein BroJett018_25050 [Chloroflexota bacterium]
MFRPKTLLLIMVIFVALPVFPASARQSDTTPLAYVYNAQADELIAIYADEVGQTYHLGIADLFAEGASYSIGANDLAFDETGSRVAFCAVDYTRNIEAVYPARLIVRDLPSATNILDLDLGTVTACRVPKKSFNAVSNTVFVSLTIAPYGDPVGIPPTWRLIRVDVAGGTIVNEVNTSTPELVSSDFADVPTAADIQYMEASGATIVFSPYPYGAGGGFEAEAYIWQIAINVITQASDWGQPIMDVLPASGERVYLDVDPSLPGGDVPVGDIPHFNAVRIVDETSVTPRTIYHRPEGAFFDVTFVNEGQQIAAQFIPDDPAANILWLIVDRDGQVTEINADHIFSDIQNAPGGYVNFWIDQEPSGDTVGTSFYLGYTSEAQSATMWNADSPDSSAYWELAWVQPVIGILDLTPFPNHRR